MGYTLMRGRNPKGNTIWSVPGVQGQDQSRSGWLGLRRAYCFVLGSNPHGIRYLAHRIWRLLRLSNRRLCIQVTGDHEADAGKRGVADGGIAEGIRDRIRRENNSTPATETNRPSTGTTDVAREHRAKERTRIALNIFVINYDRPGLFRDDTQFIEAIRNIGPRWVRPMERTWLVGAGGTITADAIQQRLLPYLDQPVDRLLVCQLTANYQGWLPQQAWDWVNQVSREYLPWSPQYG